MRGRMVTRSRHARRMLSPAMRRGRNAYAYVVNGDEAE
jgi:hypothetical protein